MKKILAATLITLASTCALAQSATADILQTTVRTWELKDPMNPNQRKYFYNYSSTPIKVRLTVDEGSVKVRCAGDWKYNIQAGTSFDCQVNPNNLHNDMLVVLEDNVKNSKGTTAIIE